MGDRDLRVHHLLMTMRHHWWIIRLIVIFGCGSIKVTGTWLLGEMAMLSMVCGRLWVVIEECCFTHDLGRHCLGSHGQCQL